MNHFPQCPQKPFENFNHYAGPLPPCVCAEIKKRVLDTFFQGIHAQQQPQQKFYPLQAGRDPAYLEKVIEYQKYELTKLHRENEKLREEAAPENGVWYKKYYDLQNKYARKILKHHNTEQTLKAERARRLAGL